MNGFSITVVAIVLQMLEPARSTQRLKSYLRSKKNLEKVAMNNVKQAPFKKLKSLSSSTGLSAHEDCANLGSSMMVKLDIYRCILIYSSS